jgi:putative transposase
MRRRYSSDLTDAQWQLIMPLFHQQTFRDHHPREIVNALFYLNKTGCQWRMLPEGFPPWQTVYYHLRRWMEMGLIEELNDRLRRAARVKDGREPSPSAAVIDSQSVPTSRVGGPRGFDGGKRIHGRKRHIITDTLGLLLAVLVHPANIHDSQRAPHLIQRMLGKVPRLQVIFADQGYSGTPKGLIWRCFGWLSAMLHRLHLVSRDKGQKGFAVEEKRWIVERTFSWFGGARRLTKDYEYLPEVSEAMVQLRAIRLTVSRVR